MGATAKIGSVLGTVLLAHGSRDLAWRAPIEAVRSQMLHQQPDAQVCCAYLELCPPTLAEAVDALIAQGARQLQVVPLFLGLGKHARRDLPALVAAQRAAHPTLAIHLAPPVGEDPRLVRLLAEIALAGPSA